MAISVFKIGLPFFLAITILFANNDYTFASDVLINEIYYNVNSSHGREPDNEWIELYNGSESDIDLTGWTITDNSSVKNIPTSVIKKKGTLIIAAKSTTWNYWTINGDKISLESNIGNGLSNSGDRLILKDSSAIEHDTLSFGTDNTYTTLAAVAEGHSLERSSFDGQFIDQTNPTPGITIYGLSIPSSTPTSSPSPSTPQNIFEVSNIPSTINSAESFTTSINLQLPDNPNTTFYLKGAFIKEGGSNYFGLTKVSTNWVKNSSKFSDQYQITTNSSGTWTGNLEIIPDTSDSGFTNSGDYLFKLGRYSQDGSGPTWSNSSIIHIDYQLPSSNPTPSTLTYTVDTQPKLTSLKNPTSSSKIKMASIAGVTSNSSPSSPSSQPIKTQKATFNINLIPTISGGLLIFIGVSYLVYLNRKRS